MMLKTALANWVAPTINRQLKPELRRGDDYTILDTKAEHMVYDPHKLSVEKVASAFSPEDRSGALEMQNLLVQDNRSFLVARLRSLSKLPAGAERPALAALLSAERSSGSPRERG